ncbi:hypothetical protein RN001_004008 [Aquatica leii]|uniref:MOSC domain-containing protein n=1 Tax=Aquatica leii TaxID=1421715 RepID=A0AAN7QA22_9COLE|nr:hypothetical protein RN001_004008 [Aquatica leii]
MLPKYSIVIAATAAATSLAVYYYRKSIKDVIWEPVGVVDGLYIYPLKSGHRVELNSANCTEFGLQLNTSYALHLRDRCLVVYNEETKAFQTARNYKKMVLIETFTTENGYILIAPEAKALRLKIPSTKDNFQDEIIMWNGERVFTIDCGDEAAKWVSTYLLERDFGLRIGYHNGVPKRNIKKYHEKYIKIHKKLQNATSGMYSDLSTVLLMNKSSVNDLITKIPDSGVTVHNFRPNIVIRGDITPYSEDDWEKIKIGDTVLETTMPCSRCSMVTINPETAYYHENYEPIRTLKTYRKLTRYPSGQTYPNLGIYMSLREKGKINVGDVVYVAKK